MADRLMTIPLTQLQRSKDNVRKTGRSTNIDSLAAMIDAQGLLQNLTVRPRTNGGKKPLYEVTAGDRRLQALRLLAKRKRLPQGFKVPCMLDEEKASSLEVSLAENVGREPLHPADQFEAFSKLNAQGLGSADIAARFGVTENVVAQRLKLAAVSPKLMAVYREGGMTLDQLTAFAISDDHQAQEHVWFDAVLFDRSAPSLRRALTKALVEGGDRRARLIGVETYEAAGGVVVRDLFDESSSYFADSQLLDRLVSEKLECEAQKIRNDGWAWVEVQLELDYQALARFGRLQPIALSKSDERKLQRLCDRYDTLVTDLDDEPEVQADTEIEQLSSEIEALSQKREQWSDDQKAHAGVIVSLDPGGTLQVTRGLIRHQPDHRSRDERQARQQKVGEDRR